MDAIGQSNFLQALGWAVLNSLWQMALLWVLYQGVTGVFKQANASRKSMLATGLLISGFAWFVYTFASIYITQSVGDSMMAPGFAGLEGNARLNDWLARTLPVASVLYLVLLIFPLLHFIRNYRYVQVIRNQGLAKAGVEWRIFVKRVAASLGIRKPVQVWVSELVSSPVTIGFIKPVILVPMAAVNHLTTEQLEAVLLHELVHIRRADYFINLIIKFIQSILYFNPFVKAFVKIVEREREKSCDEMVIQFQYDPHGYASALLELERADYFPKPLAVAASGKKNDLLHRIEWIMGVQKQPVVSFNKLAGLFAGLLCIIALNALVILSKPNKGNNTPIAGFSALNSPLYFFTDDIFSTGELKEKTAELASLAEVSAATVINEMKSAVKNVPDAQEPPDAPAPPDDKSSLAEKINYITENPLAVAVSLMDKPAVPELKQYEEAQVKEAIQASRKVLQEGQWKEVEKRIAEVFTQQQKEQLKSEYQKEINKMDWKKWEEQLRSAYNQVDWDRVNQELGQALRMVRIDSLTRVYSKAMTNLSEMEKELTKLEIESIPDSDITLRSVEEKKRELERTINRLKAVRNKQVIRL